MAVSQYRDGLRARRSVDRTTGLTYFVAIQTDPNSQTLLAKYVLVSLPVGQVAGAWHSSPTPSSGEVLCGWPCICSF